MVPTSPRGMYQTEQHPRSIRLFSSLPGRIAQQRPITLARSFKQPNWSAHQIQKGESSLHANVEKMFFQVKVKKEDQNFFHFLWCPDGDLTQEPQEYCMTVHLVETGSSPECSNFAPKRTAKDGEEEFGARAAETLKLNFYVDDALKSVPTEKDAIEPY